jgi:hypothetical protein
LVLRPSGSRPDTYVLDERGRLSAEAAYPEWPNVAASRSQDEAVVVDGSAWAVGRHAQRMGVDNLVSLAPLGGAGGLRFVAFAPEPGFGRTVQTGWTYRDGEVGVAVQVFDDTRTRGYASYRGFTASGDLGAPVDLPTQLDLASTIKPCTAEERRDDARVVAAWATGARHAVVVRSALGDDVLLTGSAILHGTPAAPCVAGWHATALSGREPRVAIVSGDLSQAWLFRESPGKVGSVDVQALACRWAPDAALPEPIWREQGAVRSP